MYVCVCQKWACESAARAEQVERACRGAGSYRIQRPAVGCSGGTARPQLRLPPQGEETPAAQPSRSTQMPPRSTVASFSSDTPIAPDN